MLHYALCTAFFVGKKYLYCTSGSQEVILKISYDICNRLMNSKSTWNWKFQFPFVLFSSDFLVSEYCKCVSANVQLVHGKWLKISEKLSIISKYLNSNQVLPRKQNLILQHLATKQKQHRSINIKIKTYEHPIYILVFLFFFSSLSSLS